MSKAPGTGRSLALQVVANFCPNSLNFVSRGTLFKKLGMRILVFHENSELMMCRKIGCNRNANDRVSTTEVRRIVMNLVKYLVLMQISQKIQHTRHKYPFFSFRKHF